MAEYLNLELSIEKTESGYRARVSRSPAGTGTADFDLPFTDLELENFLLRVGRPRRAVRRIESPEMEAAKIFGGRLYEAIFKDDVRGCLRSSLDQANQRGSGLRILLHLNEAPELADLPWEYLYEPGLNRFFSLSAETPIVRYLELPERIQPLAIKLPLKVMVMISSPSDYPPLEVEREWQNLSQAVEKLEQQGILSLERLEEATLMALLQKVRKEEFHIFHFIGHGGFDEQAQDGVLLLEDENGRGRPVSGQYLGTLLRDERTLRLAVLNACEGGRASRKDPFSGVAQSVVQQGIPAVIAMQFEVTDESAITFAREFYSAIADNYPMDASLAEARRAIYALGNNVEWGTPVLYLSATDGHIFDFQKQEELPTGMIVNPSPATLTAIQGKDENTVYPLKGVVNLIGRKENLAVSIQEPLISRLHAQISWVDDGYMLSDLNSSNGTFLNGERIPGTHSLHSGDLIRVGSTTFRFDLSAEGVGTPPPEVVASPPKAVRDVDVPAGAGRSSETGPIPQDEKPPPSPAQRLRQLPWWAWGGGGLVVLIGILGLIFSNRGGAPGVAVFPTQTFTPAAVVALTASPVVAPSHTPTIELPPTATSTQILTPTPELTNTPTAIPLPALITDSFGVPMVLVPAGPFPMGGGGINQLHTVTLDAFYIDKYEVSVGEYKKCVNAGICDSPSGPDSRTYSNFYQARFANNPVVWVTWDNAQAFCRWRQVTLPSEAQWEKAARGTDGRTYPWGEQVDCGLANYKTETRYCVANLKAVGSYPAGASPFGALDMAGNVWEWVADWYDPNYYVSSPDENPLGPASGIQRVLRGGSWASDSLDIRSAVRQPGNPDLPNDRVGFRCALNSTP